jgi:hypothetical protein
MFFCQKDEDAKPASDKYKVIRGQIEHLNNSNNQRVVWLVIAQSFFFSGFSILTTGNPEAENMKNMQHLLLIIFPIASLFTVIFSYADMIGTLLYLHKLRVEYEKAAPPEDKNYPPISGWNFVRKMQYISPVLLPIVFIVTWCYLLCI